MIVDVRQREFAFGQRGSRVVGLETGDVASCSAILAIDRENGLIFMAHLDVSVLRPFSVAKAFRELRDRASSPRNVELYDVAGFTPTMLVMSALFAAALMSAVVGVRLGLLCGALAAVGGGATRLYARLLLLYLGFKQPRLLTARDARGSLRCRFGCKVNVRMWAGAGVSAAPELYFPERPGRDPRFEVPAAGGWLRLTRAQGSE
jgi:hypothetical protein